MELNTGGLVVLEVFNTPGSPTEQLAFNTDLGEQVFAFNPPSGQTSGSFTVSVRTCPEYVRIIKGYSRMWTGLDVSNLTHLEKLMVYNNDITGVIDVSACAATLEILHIYGNELNNLTLAPPATPYQALQEFLIYENTISNDLDLSNCPELVLCHISRENNNVVLNSINNLNFAPVVAGAVGAPKLEELYAIQSGLNNSLLNLRECHALKDIRLNSNTQAPFLNQIQAIDVSGLEHIERFIVSYNDIDGTIDLSASRNTIKRIDASRNRIDTIDLGDPPLANVGSLPFPLLETFVVDYNEITNGFDFQNSPLLRHIEISFHGPDDNAVPYLYIENCPELMIVQARDNLISNAMNLGGCTKLNQILFTENQIPFLDVSGLAYIRTLSADHNQIDDIVNVVASADTLENLSLSFNKIDKVILDPNSHRLVGLGLEYNELNQLPGGLDLSGFASLQTCYISGTDSTPHQIGSLKPERTWEFTESQGPLLQYY